MKCLLGLVTVLLVVLASALGCTATIVPPESARERVSVFVLAHGWTSTLLVPAPDGALDRYAFGDWHYYALGRNTLPNRYGPCCGPRRARSGARRCRFRPTRRGCMPRLCTTAFMRWASNGPRPCDWPTS